MKPINFREALCSGIADCATAVAELKEKGWRARRDLPRWHMTLPIDWTSDPYGDVNWQFQLNAWRPIDILITGHARLKDDTLLDDIVALMLDWNQFERSHANDGVLWNDMGSGLRAAKMAYVITQRGLTHSRFDAARPVLIAMARRHLARLRESEFIGATNHALFQVHGAMALCRILPDAPEAEGGVAYVEQIFTTLLRTQFGTEGVHLEHSPGYHVFALKAAQKLLATGWYDDIPSVVAAVAMAAKRLNWFVFPDGTVSEIGDSSGAPVGPPPTAGPSHVVGRLFKEAGYAIVRNWFGAPCDRASMLVVAAGHHSSTHKHADDLSFELFESGRRLVVDSGKYTYSRQDWRNFTDSAAAHNAIDILEERRDNGIRKVAPAGGMLTDLYRPDWGWVVRGGFARPAFGIAHSRDFLYRPGKWLVLLDHVICNRPRRMTAWLHLAPELQAKAHWKGWIFPGGSIRYVTSAPGVRQRVRGQIEPHIQGWKATAYHERTPNDALGLTLTGSVSRIATIITFGDEAAPKVKISGAGFHVKHAGRTLYSGSRPEDAGASALAFADQVAGRV